tara:strand:- start:175 stop:771 length:597 start_codon:yes stop_codon:yes gene_type:complete
VLSSPFQQPSPRQNVLASQIQDAQRCGDDRRLVLLLGQWVHRFGIDSLPVTNATVPEASGESLDQLQSDPVLSMAEPAEELVETKDLDVSLDSVSQELVPPMEVSLDAPVVVGINQIPEELADTDAELTTFSQDLIVQEVLSEEEMTEPTFGQGATTTPVEPARDRNVVVAMVPPPISTPRSLRRWLPRADQSFPQAS